MRLEAADFSMRQVTGWFLHLENDNTPIFFNIGQLEQLRDLVTNTLEDYYDFRIDTIGANGGTGDHYKELF